MTWPVLPTNSTSAANPGKVSVPEIKSPAPTVKSVFVNLTRTHVAFDRDTEGERRPAPDR